jgi:cob(I)alamin adenosyltransferase
MDGPGKIRVFTGNGKGKTTAALGRAMQAISCGRKVFMIQFLKAPDTSGEHLSGLLLAPNFVLKSMGKKGFIIGRGCDPLDTLMAEIALEGARDRMMSGSYDVIILDEINVAVYLDLIQLDHLLEFIDSKPENVELILTGRYAAPEVIQRADLVREMKNVKHHYEGGVKAKKGIEF